MYKPDKLIEKFIKPWLAKNHPHADIVFLAGSFSRAIKAGNYQPMSSSDIDLVIIYSDLAKANYEAAIKIVSTVDVGTTLGEAPCNMVIDANIHDLASLKYHDKVVIESLYVPYIQTMIDEGVIVFDKLGIGVVMQEFAAKYLSEGPMAATQIECQQYLDTLNIYLHDIRAAKTIEDKRFLGILAMQPVCEFILRLHQDWASKFNQAYRLLMKKFPDEADQITKAFSDIMRYGMYDKLEGLLTHYIKLGEELLPKLPRQERTLMYPVEHYLPQDEMTVNRDTFLKFKMEHISSALQTSRKRGELAHLETLSATVNNIKTVLEIQEIAASAEGSACMHSLKLCQPDIISAAIKVLDENRVEDLLEVSDNALSHVGGLHYTQLEIYLMDDLARTRHADLAV